MKEQIIKEYQNGMSITKLSEKYPMTYYSITKLLRDNNITIRGGRQKKNYLLKNMKILSWIFLKVIPIMNYQKNIIQTL